MHLVEANMYDPDSSDNTVILSDANDVYWSDLYSSDSEEESNFASILRKKKKECPGRKAAYQHPETEIPMKERFQEVDINEETGKDIVLDDQVTKTIKLSLRSLLMAFNFRKNWRTSPPSRSRRNSG